MEGEGLMGGSSEGFYGREVPGGAVEEGRVRFGR